MPPQLSRIELPQDLTEGEDCPAKDGGVLRLQGG